MTNLLAAATLNESLAGIVAKLSELMDSFWIYIVLAMAAVVVVWGAYIGIKVAIAHRNEDKINARGMVKSLIIGIIIIKGLFLLIPAKMLSRSERELKQLKTDAKINRAKNAVSRQRLSASVRKRDTIDGLFKNAIKSATVENPVKNT